MNGDRSSNGPSPNRTAAQWVARLNADDCTSADRRGFRTWLAANPAEADRFERVTDLWDMVPGSASPPLPATPRHRAPVTRRRALAGLATLAVVGGTSTVAFQAAYAGTLYETAIGEQRHVRLDDGSTMLLDTDTRARVVATPERRRLQLARGRIDLIIAPLAIPFMLELGAAPVTATAGRFDLRRDAEDRFALTTIEGRAHYAVADAVRPLAAGERLQDGRVDRPDLAATQAWQSGRAVFDGDTLAQVVDEANRYSTTKLMIADPAAARLRVSGLYRVGDNVALGRSLATLLSLRFRTVEGAVLIGG